jgi:hypothetical protein
MRIEMLSLSGSPLQGREACIAGRALRDGGAMKGGAAKSLGKNEERNRLPWQGKVAVPCVNRAGEAVVEKAVEFSIWRFLTIVSTDDVNKIDG